MKDKKNTLASDKLEKAIISLYKASILPYSDDRVNIDATIQRFEFTIELFWKFLKIILEAKGVIAQYPKDVLKEAFAGRLIDDEKIWFEMIKDRNLTSHTYDEEFADKIYNNIKLYIPILVRTEVAPF